MATTATGALNDPSLAPLLHWAPTVCWAIAGAALVGLAAGSMPRLNRH